MPVTRFLRPLTLAATLCLGVAAPGLAQPEPAAPLTFPNHHLHNFACNERTLPIHEHALAMGYRFVAEGRPEDERFAGLRTILNTNASVCPIRVWKMADTGATRISYLGHFRDSAGKSTIAAIHGLDRRCNQLYRMTPEDLDLLRAYAAAREPVADLTVETATYDTLQERFYPKWIIDEGDRIGFNMSMNWTNRAVVDHCVQALTTHIPWQRHGALFFDSLGDGSAPIRTLNADALPGGHYPTRAAGHLAFVKAVCDFARDPARTGCEEPYQLFANIYDPLSPINRKLCALPWYGHDTVRFDHYYLERGGPAAGPANGVVPGTTEPAYVDDAPGADPLAYLPARLVALDDPYGWSRKREFLDNFDHDAFFEAHLQACGHAAAQGSWFGWYGEDTVTKRDGQGRLLYSSANQLLRAIPGWDNMSGIAVPPAGQSSSSTSPRRFGDNVYQSANSLASRAVIGARNPENGQLYVVFLEPDARLRLNPGEQVVAAHVADASFAETDRDAFKALAIDPAGPTIGLADPALVGTGLRLGIRPSEFP